MVRQDLHRGTGGKEIISLNREEPGAPEKDEPWGEDLQGFTVSSPLWIVKRMAFDYYKKEAYRYKIQGQLYNRGEWWKEK